MTFFFNKPKILPINYKIIYHCDIMPKEINENENLEAKWNDDKYKIVVSGLVTREASEFLEIQAFNNFGNMKKSAIGLELTKLILKAKECMEKEK